MYQNKARGYEHEKTGYLFWLKGDFHAYKLRLNYSSFYLISMEIKKTARLGRRAVLCGFFKKSWPPHYAKCGGRYPTILRNAEWGTPSFAGALSKKERLGGICSAESCHRAFL